MSSLPRESRRPPNGPRLEPWGGEYGHRQGARSPVRARARTPVHLGTAKGRRAGRGNRSSGLVVSRPMTDHPPASGAPRPPRRAVAATALLPALTAACPPAAGTPAPTSRPSPAPTQTPDPTIPPTEHPAG